MKQKNFIIFMSLLILALIIRIPNLKYSFANDEQDMAMNSLYYVKEGVPKVLDWEKQDNITAKDLIHSPNHSYLSHVWPYALFTYLPFSWETNLRLYPMILGIVIIFLSYLLAKESFDQKTAIITAIVSTISVAHVYQLSYRLSMNITMIFFLMLTYIYYFRYQRSQLNKYLYYASIAATFAVASRFLQGTVLLAALIFYELIQKRWKNVGKVSITFIVVFILFLTATGQVNNFTDSLKIQSGLESKPLHFLWTMPELITELVQQAQIALYLTSPLVAILIIVSLQYLKQLIKTLKTMKFKQIRRFIMQPNIMLYCWCIVNSMILLLTSGGGGSESNRHFMVAIPFILIIASNFVSKFDFKRYQKQILLSFVIYFCSLMLFKVNDAMIYTFLLKTTSLIPTVIWLLPFILIVTYFIKKHTQISIAILVGLFLAMNIYAAIFSHTIWTINNSQTVDIIKQQQYSNIFSKSGFVIRNSIMYDFLDNNKIDNRYFFINNLTEWETFIHRQECIPLYTKFSYTHAYSCNLTPELEDMADKV